VRSIVLCLTVMALSASMCLAAPGVGAVRCVRAPDIDGEVLSDAVWSTAPVARGFTILKQPDVPASQATDVHVLYDDDCLYVAFVCHEARMSELVARAVEHDGATYLDDSVELFLSPFPQRRPYFHFVVNCDGVLRDEKDRVTDWQSRARVATRKANNLWSAELAIPFDSMGLDVTVSATWAANFCRNEQPHKEVSSWAPCKEGFHEPESFGQITGIEANFGPVVARSLQVRTEDALTVLRKVKLDASRLRDNAVARALYGNCFRLIGELEAVSAELEKRPSMERAAELSATLAAAEAELETVRARHSRLALLGAAGEAGYAVCQDSTMRKVRPDRPYSGRPADKVTISLARNEYEAAQLVVVPIEQTLRDVQVSVGPLRMVAGFGARPEEATAAPRIDIKRVEYVEVKERSGGAPLEPGLLPDPLVEATAVNIDRTQVRSWWLTAHAEDGLPPGLYRGEVVVKPRNADETRLPLEVRVWGFALPKTSRLRSSYGINLSMVYNMYDLAAGPGQPAGWISGSWQGADVEGRPNYYGSMDYTLAFDYEIKHSDRRSCRVEVTRVEPGDSESPRFCYYTPPLELEPDTDYDLSVWYRTAPGDEHGPACYVGAPGGTVWPPTEGQWKEGRFSFNSGEAGNLRVYLRVDRVGTVWLDDVWLKPRGASPWVNLLPNPGFEVGDETLRDTLREAYYENALKHRCSPTDLVRPDITFSEDGTVKIDWTQFDEAMQRYIDLGLSAFNVSWCQLPSGWGSVETVQDEARISRARELLRQTQEHLDQKGWTHLAYIYTIDEPGAKAFEQVKQAFELAHAAAPRLKRLLTYGYGASRPIEPGKPVYADLAGFVDIHVPHSDCYEPIYLGQRRAMGEEIWAYVCISAQRPWLNCWGIDYPGMDHRLLFWQLFANDITGFLYWQITYWQDNPWTNTLTYPGGNGDGSLVYPGEGGPVDSIRWELCRDGTEDYDMLLMLREAIISARARNINIDPDPYLKFDDLTSDWTTYSEDPAVLEAQRSKVGDFLEELTRRLEG